LECVRFSAALEACPKKSWRDCAMPRNHQSTFVATTSASRPESGGKPHAL
jgi:hypothetical protein